eukprot:GEMP01026667.1.p1 GENE.GEMP01026667.1~~GEMP01026667.1.p1  ORF type:complete len:209 (+),score=29.08 GEMP01026667.1:30-656(+)
MRIQGKVIAAGPANAGKTCLIERYVRNIFAASEPSHGPTLSCDCYQKKTYVDDTEVHLFIYDTAGQERFADMGGSYYRGADVCLLCFDLSNLASFDNARWWMKKVTEYNERCSFILVGTKEDLFTNAESGPPDFNYITRWCADEGIPFFPTSAKAPDSNGITFLFHTVAEKCLRQSREKQLKDLTDKHNRVVTISTTIGRPKEQCCST